MSWIKEQEDKFREALAKVSEEIFSLTHDGERMKKIQIFRTIIGDINIPLFLQDAKKIAHSHNVVVLLKNGVIYELYNGKSDIIWKYNEEYGIVIYNILNNKIKYKIWEYDTFVQPKLVEREAKLWGISSLRKINRVNEQMEKYIINTPDKQLIMGEFIETTEDVKITYHVFGNKRKVTIATSLNPHMSKNETNVLHMGYAIMNPGDKTNNKLGETISKNRLWQQERLITLPNRPSKVTIQALAKDYYHYLMDTKREQWKKKIKTKK